MTQVELQLEAPAATGSMLRGWWHGEGLQGEPVGEMHLACRHNSPQGWKRRVTAILWERMTIVYRSGDRFPFAVHLPTEAPGSADGEERIEWTVRLTVGRARANISIVIPVTGRAPRALEVPLATAADPQAADDAEALATAAGIAVERAPRRVGYDCRGYRPVMLFLLFTVLLGVFFLGFALLPDLFAHLNGKGPDAAFNRWWLGIVGSIGGLTLFLNLRTILLRVRCVADADGIEVRWGWLIPWRRRFIPAAAIHGIVRTRTLSDGTAAFWDRRRFHQLFVDHGQRGMISDLRARGRLTRCAWMIPDLLTAQAIQADLERALGLAQHRAEAGREPAGAGRSAP